MPYYVDNKTAAELTRNHVMMKRVKKINSIAFFTYLIGGLLMICISFVSIVGVSWDWISPSFKETTIIPFSAIAFIMIADSIVVCPLSFYLTYRASMLYHSLSAMLVIALQAVNLIFMIILNAAHIIDRVPTAFISVAIYSVACLIAGAANMWAVIKYHWLEDQEGFPQFNARFEEYKEHRREREIMDPYELRKRQLERGSTGAMNDLGSTQEELGQYEKVHVPSEMDSI